MNQPSQRFHEAFTRIMLFGSIVGIFLFPERMPFEFPVLVMTDKVVDGGVFCRKIEDEFGIGFELGFRKVVGAVDTADILDADAAVIETDDMACHRGFVHQTVDGAVSIDEEMDRDIECRSRSDIAPGIRQTFGIERFPCLLEVTDRGLMDNNDTRNDFRIV